MTPMATNKQTEKSIIEALKGLTFKIEIKITDIVGADRSSAATETPATAPTAAQPRVVTPAHVSGASRVSTKINTTLYDQALVATPAPEPGNLSATGSARSTLPKAPELAQQASTPDSVVVERPEPVVPQVPNPNVHPASSTEEPIKARPTPSQPAAIASTKAIEKPPIVAPKQSAPNNAQQVDVKQAQKPRYPTGSVKIGTQMRTICIAVDETVNPAVAYIAYDSQEIANITNAITDISDEIESDPEVSSLHVGDIVFAKSIEDNNWYRAIIEEIKEQVYIKVHYFDWGLGETLSIKRIRRLNRLELGLSKHPACAVKVQFTNATEQKLNDVLSCQVEFDIKVMSYDEASQVYSCTLTS